MTGSEKHKTTTRSREIPSDPRLPGLSTLLDAGRVEAILAPRVDGSYGRVEDCRSSYVRYKPATSCVVTYTLRCAGRDGEEAELLFYGKCYTGEDFSNAARKADTERWVDVEGLEPVLLLPELCSIFYAYPNDRELAGLRVIAQPKKIQRMLYDHLTTYPNREWRISDKRLRATTVRYKPEKRAVVRLDTRATHRRSGTREPVCVYMRAYSDGRGEALFALMKELHQAFHEKEKLEVPRPLVYLPDKCLLLVEGLSGEPMLTRLSGRRAAECVAESGRALAALHRFEGSGLGVRSAADLLDDARSTGDTLRHVAPEAQTQIEQILAALEGSRPDHAGDNPGFVHGDFYHGQVLIQDRGQAILDFDRSYSGDPVADVGNFCAHLRLLELQDRISGWRQLQDAFVTAYLGAAAELDPDRLRFWTAVGLFQLSVGPFRSLQPSWREKAERILEACRSVLT